MSSASRGSVALVTCAAYPQLSDDDRLLLPALSALTLTRLAALPALPWVLLSGLRAGFVLLLCHCAPPLSSAGLPGRR